MIRRTSILISTALGRVSTAASIGPASRTRAAPPPHRAAGKVSLRPCLRRSRARAGPSFGTLDKNHDGKLVP